MKVILKKNNVSKKGELLYPIEEGEPVWLMNGQDSVKLPIVKEISLWNKLGFALKFITLTNEEYNVEYENETTKKS